MKRSPKFTVALTSVCLLLVGCSGTSSLIGQGTKFSSASEASTGPTLGMPEPSHPSQDASTCCVPAGNGFLDSLLATS